MFSHTLLNTMYTLMLIEGSFYLDQIKPTFRSINELYAYVYREITTSYEKSDSVN